MKSDDMNPRFQAAFVCRRGFLPVRHVGDKSDVDRGMKFLLNSYLARTWIVADTNALAHSSFPKVKPAEPTSHTDTLPKVAAGESRAMDLCIERHAAIVWSIVRRYLKDTAEAEDLVQEVFTEIWKKASSFDPAIATESTFVGMIARRRGSRPWMPPNPFLNRLQKTHPSPATPKP